MAITEKVSEKVSELRGDLRDAVENLKQEVSELKSKLTSLVPGRRGPSVPVPVRHEPRDVLAQWREETDRLFDELWRGLGAADPTWLDRGMGWPRVDLEDSEDEIRVTAEMPGIDERDVDVRLAEGRLTIRGEKRSEREERRERNYYRSECFYGSFERTIPLPAEIDPDGVKADFRKGVLTVRLPKTPGARERVRRIPVRGN